MDRPLTPAEAVLKIRELPGGRDVTEGSLSVMRAKRQGPAYYKIRSRVFYREADLKAWLKPTRVEPDESRSVPGSGPVSDRSEASTECS